MDIQLWGSNFLYSHGKKLIVEETIFIPDFIVNILKNKQRILRI